MKERKTRTNGFMKYFLLAIFIVAIFPLLFYFVLKLDFFHTKIDSYFDFWYFAFFHVLTVFFIPTSRIQSKIIFHLAFFIQNVITITLLDILFDSIKLEGYSIVVIPVIFSIFNLLMECYSLLWTKKNKNTHP